MMTLGELTTKRERDPFLVCRARSHTQRPLSSPCFPSKAGLIYSLHLLTHSLTHSLTHPPNDSFCRYDFMLLDLWDAMPPHQHACLEKLRSVYWDTVKKTYCCASKGGGRGGAGEEGGGGAAAAATALETQVDEAAFAVLKRDVTLLTASHYFTIVPLHETRPRQLRYLQQARKMLREEGLL
jgi:hypothetical protein